MIYISQSKVQPMETSSRNRSSQGTTLVGHRFFPSSISASSSTTFPARSEQILHRPTSPTRVTLGRSVSPSPSVRISASQRHPLAAASHHHHHRRPSSRSLNPGPKKTCMCSPTTHPGSFRCSLHKGSLAPGYSTTHQMTSYRSSQHHLNMRRSAMTNSLVRIGTVEGDLLRRALSALIRPSSHSLRRRSDFRPRKSRLSVMSKAEEDL